eukprot:GHVU01032019.1.p3 GENE.GHVU01032019.1~~GHVU01032019.1.p3  ORF type:complete len:120 (+),score=8.42 GHVU01032019.1:537-896(+)
MMSFTAPLLFYEATSISLLASSSSLHLIICFASLRASTSPMISDFDEPRFNESDYLLLFIIYYLFICAQSQSLAPVRRPPRRDDILLSGGTVISVVLLLREVGEEVCEGWRRWLCRYKT